MNKKRIINSIFYPRKSFLSQDKKDVLITVEQDIKIGARLFLQNNTYANILYFHGNAELAQEYDVIGNSYNSHGINFIVADYRGYGLSDGEPDKDSLHHDAIKIFDYVLSYLKDNHYNGSMIIMGRSLGSASACEIISKREADIDKCIIESGFGTEYPLLELMNIDKDEIKYSLLDGFRNLEKIKKYRKPIYFIHADMDHIIPISEAQLMMKESASKDKDLFVVNGADHNNIIMITKDIYFQKIKDFINNE